MDTRNGKIVFRKIFLHNPLWGGAVPKNGDPLGRLIHDYSFPSAIQGSVNSALINTSVEYISFVERAAQLSQVEWFIKVDMKNGYRQLGVHPRE